MKNTFLKKCNILVIIGVFYGIISAPMPAYAVDAQGLSNTATTNTAGAADPTANTAGSIISGFLGSSTAGKKCKEADLSGTIGLESVISGAANAIGGALTTAATNMGGAALNAAGAAIGVTGGSGVAQQLANTGASIQQGAQQLTQAATNLVQQGVGTAANALGVNISSLPSVTNLIPGGLPGVPGLGGGGAVPISSSKIEGSTDRAAIATEAQDAWQSKTKPTKDCLTYSTAQNTLNSMTKDTISWIKGGFNGNPLYAVNPDKLLFDIADAASGGLAKQIMGLQMCDFSGLGNQFKFDLANAVNISTPQRPEVKFAEQLSCPFSSLIDLQSCTGPSPSTCTRITPNQFFNDFSKGGWRAFETTLTDTGNPFGTAIKTNVELAERKSQTEKIVEKKQSDGFFDKLDIASCEFPSELNIDSTTPPEQLKVYQLQYCKTTTPAKMIESQLSETLNTDMQRVGFADNMNKIFSSFLEDILGLGSGPEQNTNPQAIF